MPIIVNLDIMMARRKISLGELAEKIDLTPANLSILKTGKAKAVCACLSRNYGYLCIRKVREEIGKWLMDVAKYVATAVLITSFLGEFEEKWLVYTIGILTVILCFFGGLWFIRRRSNYGRHCNDDFFVLIVNRLSRICSYEKGQAVF